MSSRVEHCARVLVLSGISVIWSGIAWAAVVQLIALR
jgi:hypothetical protein